MSLLQLLLKSLILYFNISKIVYLITPNKHHYNILVLFKSINTDTKNILQFSEK